MGPGANGQRGRVRLAGIVSLLAALAIACEADRESLDSGRATAETAGRKAIATGEAMVRGPWGIRFEYPLLNDPVIVKQRLAEGLPIDSEDRGLDGWEVQQAFDVANTFISATCASLQFNDAPDCRHAGVDLWADAAGASDVTTGLPVYPIADGTVVEVHDTGSYPGDAVLIRHETDAGALYSMYGHIDADPGLEGQVVTATTRIGAISAQVGNAHLHFEIRTFENDPAIFDNGVFECGCIVGPGYWLASRGGPEQPVAERPEVRWLDPLEVIERSRRSLR